MQDSRDVITRGMFTPVADLSRKLINYIPACAKPARPIHWTFAPIPNDASASKQSLEQPLDGHAVGRQMPKFVEICNDKDRLNLALLNAKGDNPHHTMVFRSDRSRQTVDWQTSNHLLGRTEFCSCPDDQPCTFLHVVTKRVSQLDQSLSFSDVRIRGLLRRMSKLKSCSSLAAIYCSHRCCWFCESISFGSSL